jgi:hypothetical protein
MSPREHDDLHQLLLIIIIIIIIITTLPRCAPGCASPTPSSGGMATPPPPGLSPRRPGAMMPPPSSEPTWMLCEKIVSPMNTNTDAPTMNRNTWFRGRRRTERGNTHSRQHSVIVSDGGKTRAKRGLTVVRSCHSAFVCVHAIFPQSSQASFLVAYEGILRPGMAETLNADPAPMPVCSPTPPCWSTSPRPPRMSTPWAHPSRAAACSWAQLRLTTRSSGGGGEQE